MKIRNGIIYTAAAAALMVNCQSGARAQDAKKLQLGFMSTMSGPLGALGAEQKRGLDLAIADLHGKVGGLDTQVFAADDHGQATAAVQAASKLIDEDKVDLVTGVIYTPALIAAAKTFIQSGRIVVSANAGPAAFAGKNCNRNFFFTAWQNDQADEAVGTYLNNHGFKRVFFLGFDNQAGFDHVNGAKRTFKGQNVGEAYTNQSQLDFSTELAKIGAAKPDALYAFLVGAPAVAFVKQFSQSGLKIPVFSFALADATNLKAEGEAALGIKVAGPYFPFIKNPQNTKFVSEFRAKFGRDPSFIAADQYDTMMLIDSAIRSIHGNLKNRAALRSAIFKADFKSLRGSFKFNTNHFPIQNFYIAKVAKNAKGKLTFAKVDLAVKEGKDSFYKECMMKP